MLRLRLVKMARNNPWGWSSALSFQDVITAWKIMLSLKGQSRALQSLHHLTEGGEAHEAKHVHCEGAVSLTSSVKSTLWPWHFSITSGEWQHSRNAFREGHPLQAHTHVQMHPTAKPPPKVPRKHLNIISYVSAGWLLSVTMGQRGTMSFMCVTTEPAPSLARELYMYVLHDSEEG